jgi:hypothetical protein
MRTFAICTAVAPTLAQILALLSEFFKLQYLGGVLYFYHSIYWLIKMKNGGIPAVQNDIEFASINRIAIAVVELEAAIELFSTILDFTLMRRLRVNGDRTEMVSAEMEKNGIKFCAVPRN